MPKVSVEGKQTLFFSKNAADQSWRFKEKMVAVIESFFQNRNDLFTFSSTKIRDIVNDLEDLDAAFASIEDPTDFFSFVEVRDRGKKVGRQYIQEVMGKRTSLSIDTCKIVSTKGFTRNAIRLAFKVDIPLRMLLPESNQNIKKWFSPDYIGMESPLVEIAKCSVLARSGDKILEFKADQAKSLENNILVPTENPDKYKVISLSRVFDVDVMRNQKHREDFLANVPMDNKFHKATVSCQYEEPRLYLKVNKTGNDSHEDRILPIAAIVFFLLVSRQSVNAPINHRYKYLDAVTEEKIAEVIVADILVDKQPYYISLIRHSCDGESCQIGGASFR